MSDKEKYSKERRKNYPTSTRVAEMADAAVEDMLDFPESTARGIGRYGLAAGMYAPAIGVDVGRRIKDKVMGTKEQNEESADRMRKMDEKNPDSAQAKVNKVLGMKAGGKVSKADMQKAGFYDKDKTKAERQNIVKKVTTKPQRVAIVEKAFSTKNMKAGGMASKRADGCAIRGKTRA
jgi:hypothetical protein